MDQKTTNFWTWQASSTTSLQKVVPEQLRASKNRLRRISRGPGDPPGRSREHPRSVPEPPVSVPEPSREPPGRSRSTPKRPPDDPNPSRATPKAPQSLPRTEFCVLSGRPLHEKLLKPRLQSSSSVRTFPSTAACAQHIESGVRSSHMACWIFIRMHLHAAPGGGLRSRS